MRIQTDNFGFGEKFRCGFHKENYNYPAHLHQFAEIAIVLGGELEITVDDTTRIAKKGDIAIIKPFAVHSFLTPKSCDVWIFVFSRTYIVDFDMENGLQKADFIFTPTKSLFEYICDHFINVSERNLFNIRACVYSLLEEYSRTVPSVDRQYEFRDIHSAIFRYMSSNFKEKLTLSSLAQELNYSTWHISKALSSIPNVNFYTILAGLRIEHAKQLILTSDMRILDIALECGFSNERSFHRSFKQNTEMTPLEFKRKYCCQ